MKVGCQSSIECREPGGRSASARPGSGASTLDPGLVRCHAFTLIEILVAVAIVGIIMTMAIPSIYRQLHPESMQKAVTDLMEACSHARAQAILNGNVTELIINLADRTVSVGTAGSGSRAFSPDVEGKDWRMPERTAPAAGGAGFSARLAENIIIEGLGVSGEDWTEEETARVRFYPNGTSDEMSIVLRSDQNERRNIWLEVVTGLAEVEIDPLKFRAR